jgi:hypothetical protein
MGRAGEEENELKGTLRTVLALKISAIIIQQLP